MKRSFRSVPENLKYANLVANVYPDYNLELVTLVPNYKNKKGKQINLKLERSIN